MAKKKTKYEKRKFWCWYCDREFEEEKVLIQHQRMKHFQCNICHRKLNSASGLVIHMAQVHKVTMDKVPNAVEGHDTPELEIFGTDGIPAEDLQRHLDGLPIVPYTKSRLIIGDASILPILAAQKASVAALLAESKNMTVQGDLLFGGNGGGGDKGAATPALATSVVSPSISSAMTSSSAPIPAVAPPAVANPNPFWNNPYAMAAYYQQQQGQQQGMQGMQYQQQQHILQQQQQYYQQQYQAFQPYGHVPPPTQYPPSQIPPPQFLPAQTKPPVLSSEPVIESTNNPEEFANDSAIIIPPYVDPNTNKSMPGTIFTVPSLDLSLEEMRSDLKKYRYIASSNE